MLYCQVPFYFPATQNWILALASCCRKMCTSYLECIKLVAILPWVLFQLLLVLNTLHSFKILETTYLVTQCNVPDDLHVQQYCCENLKSCVAVTSQKTTIWVIEIVKEYVGQIRMFTMDVFPIKLWNLCPYILYIVRGCTGWQFLLQRSSCLAF